MSRPFTVEGPEVSYTRQVEFVLVGGGAEVQELGDFTSKNWRMFWATQAEVTAQIESIIGDGWVLDGGPSLSPIYPPLDLYNATIEAHKHTV